MITDFPIRIFLHILHVHESGTPYANKCSVPVNHNIIHVKSQLFLIILTAFDLTKPQPFLFTAILRLLSGRSPAFWYRFFHAVLRCKTSFCLFCLTVFLSFFAAYTTFTATRFLIFSLRSAAICRRDDAFTHHEPSAVRNRLPGTISDIRTISNFPDGVNRHSPQIQPHNF